MSAPLPSDRVPLYSVRISGSGRSWSGLLYFGPMVAEAVLHARSEKAIQRKADRWLAKMYARVEQSYMVTAPPVSLDSGDST